MINLTSIIVEQYIEYLNNNVICREYNVPRLSRIRHVFRFSFGGINGWWD